MFIDLCNELIDGTGELYATSLALEELFTPERDDIPHFSRQIFDELTHAFEAANTLLFKQLCELKTVRAQADYQALAKEHIAQVRATFAEARKKAVKSGEEAAA